MVVHLSAPKRPSAAWAPEAIAAHRSPPTCPGIGETHLSCADTVADESVYQQLRSRWSGIGGWRGPPRLFDGQMSMYWRNRAILPSWTVQIWA